VLCYVDSLWREEVEMREKCFFLFMARCLAFWCTTNMMPAQAIASLSVWGVAAAKFLGPHPNDCGDDVPVKAQRADLSHFCPCSCMLLTGPPLNQRHVS
jgi:hypothetical protein